MTATGEDDWGYRAECNSSSYSANAATYLLPQKKGRKIGEAVFSMSRLLGALRRRNHEYGFGKADL